ncbi:DEAD/DEAH box helicase [Phenylobacterium sp.]|uniref:DEAD/DEAH box helicase n=1 Tax=Phenylobacterium sp. TaxID=1871053 RepID=UPI00301E2D24
MPFPATHPALARALEAQGYREPTPVQAAVLEAPADRDLLVSAQTGSGKTVAFGLAAAAALLGEAAGFDAAGAPLGLVIAPTRELALQVARELGWLYAPAGVRIATCVGGMDPRAEQRALAAGAHIVVGTPGRLRDHLERGNLDTSALRVAVLDEADEMLDMGFREDLEAILDSAPAERRTFLFSATIAREIAALARRYQRDAHRIDTIRRDEPHGDIAYRAVRVAPTDVENAVVNILRYYESPGALIFCATRERVRHLYGSLRERGFAVVQLSGELSQKERSDALQALRDGHARACIATDVAARGLDLPELGLVIHADLPAGPPALLHRSGRTGRAGRKGVSVIIAPHPKRRQAERLLQVAGVEAEWSAPPSPEEIRARDEARLFDDPALAEPPTPQDLELARRLLERQGAEAVAAALVRLHRSRLPEPEDILPDRGGEPRPLRPERQAQIESADGSWFRLPIGRSKNADPKWLVPLICRLGHVTKKDIGLIRIFDHETKFQIAGDVEARFQDAVRAAADAGELRINPSSPPGAAPQRAHAERARPGRPDARPGRPPHRPRGPDPKGPPPRRKPRKA